MIKLENYFGICLFGGGFLGFLFPSLFSWGQPFLSYLLMLALFLGFLRVDLAEVTHLKKGMGRLFIYALLASIFMPSAFFFASGWIPFELRLGLFLMLATCAGANAPLIVSFLRLRILWASVFVAMTSLLVTFALPVMVAEFFKFTLTIDALEMSLFLGKIIIIPAILAVIFRKYFGTLAQQIQSTAGTIGTLNLAFFMAVLVSLNHGYIQESGLSWLTLYAILGMFVVFFIRFFVGFLLPAKSADERWTNGLMFVIINNNLVILLAAEFFSPEIFWIALLSQIPWIMAFPAIRIFRNKFIHHV